MKFKKGFTLIELLVVIAIIAVLVAFTVANLVGARSRARDVKKKSELQEVKNALRLYYNDYNNYPGPASAVANTFNGCGTANPTTLSCVSPPCSGQFAAGGTSGCGSVVYMKMLPAGAAAGGYDWHYEQMPGGDDFCLWTSLENKSDTEIANSQAKCSVCSAVGYVAATDYVVCAD